MYTDILELLRNNQLPHYQLNLCDINIVTSTNKKFESHISRERPLG